MPGRGLSSWPRHGVRFILRIAVTGGAFHPAEIGPGGKALAGRGQDDNPHPRIGGKLIEGLGKRRDNAVIERVMTIRPVEEQAGDRTLFGHLYVLFGRQHIG